MSWFVSLFSPSSCSPIAQCPQSQSWCLFYFRKSRNMIVQHNNKDVCVYVNMEKEYQVRRQNMPFINTAKSEQICETWKRMLCKMGDKVCRSTLHLLSLSRHYRHLVFLQLTAIFTPLQFEKESLFLFLFHIASHFHLRRHCDDDVFQHIFIIIFSFLF